MKIKDFVAKLSPFTKRLDILERIDMVQDVANDVVVPMLKEYEKSVGSKWKAEGNVQAQAEIEKAMYDKRAIRGKSWTTAALAAMKNVSDVLVYLKNDARKTFPDDLPREAVTYRKANALLILSQADFFVNYTKDALNYAAQLEAEAAGSESVATVSKFEQTSLVRDRRLFGETLGFFSQTAREIIKDLEDTADDIFVEGDENVMQVAVSRMDGVARNFTAPSYNPVYWFRIWLANRDHDRYKEAEATRSTLELRIAELKSMTSGRELTDRERKQLEYNQDRVTMLTKTINDYEAEVNGL